QVSRNLCFSASSIGSRRSTPRISAPSAGESGRTVKGAAVIVCGTVAIAPICSSLRPVPVRPLRRTIYRGSAGGSKPCHLKPCPSSRHTFLDQGMFPRPKFAPAVACRNARHATSPARPAIVDVVGDLFTDLRRLEQILPGRGVSTRLREHSILRRLF